MESNKYVFFEMNKCSRLIKRYIDNSTDKAKFEKMTGAHGWAIGFFYHNRDILLFGGCFERQNGYGDGATPYYIYRRGCRGK